MKSFRLAVRVSILAALLAMTGGVGAAAADGPKKDAAAGGPAATEPAPIDLKLPPPYYVGTPLVYPNDGVHFEEPSPLARPPFLAPKGAVVLSRGKPVTSSDADPAYGKLSMIVDGEKGPQAECVTELDTGTQWVQIDLGQPCEIYAVVVWHSYGVERVYFDLVVRAADDADFAKNVRTLYNNDFDNSSGLGLGEDKEYIETYEGRIVSALKDGAGTTARYVRLYSKGNTTDDANHFIEVEVWGKPAAPK